MTQQPSPLHLTVGLRTDVGRVRERNEDSLVQPPADLDPRLPQTKGLLCGVADGMGGQAGGERASQQAAHIVAQEFYHAEETDLARRLEHAAQVANQAIFQDAQRNAALAGMGTTLTVAAVREAELVLAHVGDSRAYLARAGDFRQLTRDHTWVQEQLERGTLRPEEVANHPRGHVLTRALGADPYVTVDIVRETLQPGDKLLICSDGLTGLVAPDEMRAILEQRPPQPAADELVHLANERGGHDNVSVVVLAAAPGGVIAAAVPSWRRYLPVLSALAALLLIAGVVSLPRLLGTGGTGGGGTPTFEARAGIGGTGTPAATNPAATGIVATGEITETTVFLRSYPLVDPSTEVAKLGKGTSLTVLGRTANNWLNVRTPIGQTGWVSGTLVSLAAATSTIPLVTPPSTPTGTAPPTASATASPPPATPSVTPTPPSTTPTPTPASPTATETATVAPTAAPSATATTTATATATCYSNLRVVAQQPAAGTFLPLGSAFNQVWTVQNTGTCNWTPDFQIVHEDGERFNGASSTRLGITWAAGTQNTIAVNGLVVPGAAGQYSGTWGLHDANGAVFGAPLVVSINVRPPATAVPPSATPIKPSATQTPVPTVEAPPTPIPLATLSVTVQSPTNGAPVSGRVPFRWQYNRAPIEGKEIFDLRVCKGEGCRLNAVTGLTNTTATSGDWCMTNGEGLYRWQVWVIDPQTKQPLGPVSDIGEFNWTGGDCR